MHTHCGVSCKASCCQEPCADKYSVWHRLIQPSHCFLEFGTCHTAEEIIERAILLYRRKSVSDQQPVDSRFLCVSSTIMSTLHMTFESVMAEVTVCHILARVFFSPLLFLTAFSSNNSVLGGSRSIPTI